MHCIPACLRYDLSSYFNFPPPNSKYAARVNDKQPLRNTELPTMAMLCNAAVRENRRCCRQAAFCM